MVLKDLLIFFLSANKLFKISMIFLILILSIRNIQFGKEHRSNIQFSNCTINAAI